MNSEFLNQYIEKLSGTITDLTKKLLLLETQFEYNVKVGADNLAELDQLKLNNSNNQSSNDIRIQELNDLINSKNNSLHQTMLQLEEIKSKLLVEQEYNSRLVLENAKLSDELLTKKSNKRNSK